MILYPAIDLKQGRAVRLYKGDMERATVFSDDPAAQAEAFAAAGCAWLHLVDLDGAFAGRPENAGVVSGILDRVGIPVQLGGGIRGMETVEGWIEETGASAVDLARSFEDAGVAAIIHTDIDRDGAMEGPGVAATAALARAVSIPVIASGGVSCMDDLRALRDCGAGLDGAVCGRALYDGAVDLAEALEELRRVT